MRPMTEHFAIFAMLTGLLFFAAPIFANTMLDSMNNIFKNRDAASINNIEKPTNFPAPSLPVYKLNSNYEFVYFYRVRCLYCQKFAPILSRYSADTKIAVHAFTFDGGASPIFPNSAVVDQKTVSDYFGSFGSTTIAVPALFIMNKVNLHVYPVARGALSYEELSSRMNELIPKILQIDAKERT